MGLVFAAQDPAVAPIVPPRMVELAEAGIGAFPGRGRRLMRMLSRQWYRRFVRAIERRTVPGIYLHYLVRKLCIGDMVASALSPIDATAPRQLVVVGAGLDSLAPRLFLSGARPDVSIIEVDHPATQGVKRRALAPFHLPAPGFTFVSLDLTRHQLADALAASGAFDPTLPSVFVAEGLLMYLTENQAATFFRELAGLAPAGSRVVFTFMESDRRDRVRFKNLPRWYAPLLDRWLRRVGEPMRWAIDRTAIRSWLAPTGWALEEIADRDALRARYLTPNALGDRALMDGEYVGVAGRAG